MWQFIARQESQYTRRQRKSIKAMARRRQTDPGFRSPMPGFDDGDSIWDNFFSQQLSAREQIHGELVAWHLTKLEACADMAVLYSYMTSLFSSLLLLGFTRDQLFLDVCKGVLDPSRDSCPEEDLLALWHCFAQPTPTEFIAHTKLVPIGTDQVSNTLLRKWSRVVLPAVECFNSDKTQVVLVGTTQLEPFVITKRAVVGGIEELHRREAQHVYSLRLQERPELSVFVLSTRSHFKPTTPGSKEKCYDVNFRRTESSVTDSQDTVGAVLFQKASRDLFDSPEDAIRDLFVGAEIRWARPFVGQTDEILVDAYRWSLRRRLGKDFLKYLSRVRPMSNDPRIPSGCVVKEIGAGAWEDVKAFPSLEARLARLQDLDDELVLYRLRELNHWYTIKSRPLNELSRLANTFREIDDLIAITRGLRNSATHFEATDQRVNGIVLYLTKVLFEAFIAAWTRDSVRQASSVSAA